MSYWSGVTRNLVMQNSTLVRQHGGDLGTTTWSYVKGSDGVKTIDPIVGFYLSPPPDARCRWSTNNGRCPPNHIVISDDDGNEDAMPPRELIDWNDETIQAKVEQYRHQYWEDLKNLVRPNTFEDLYELFDSATLWSSGAYNLWKLVNALITLAHGQFPHVLQDWKNHIEKVVYEVFRPVTGSRLVRGVPNNNMQVLRNQQVLAEWDRTVDPIVLLQHTTFPVGDLPLMNVQQHGLLRELLICEHIRLSGTQSPIPQYYNYPRSIVDIASFAAPIPIPAPAPINIAIQATPGDAAMQRTPPNTSVQQSKPRVPLVAVGTIDPDGQRKTQPQYTPNLPKEPPASVPVGQSSGVSISPSLASLPSIPEGTASIEIGGITDPGATETGISSFKEAFMPPEVTTSICKGVNKDANPFLKASPSTVEPQDESSAPGDVTEEAPPRVEVQFVKVAASMIDILVKQPSPVAEFSGTEDATSIPRIVAEETTLTPDSSRRDSKDGNRSTDKLFFPNTPSDKYQGGRQRSVASAPEQDTEPMLTLAEKNARIICETPPAMQAHCDQQYTSYSASDASVVHGPTSQGLLRFHVPGHNNGHQQSGHTGYQKKPMLQHGRHMGPYAPRSSQMAPPFGRLNGMLQTPGPFNPSPSNMQPVSGGAFFPGPPGMQTGPDGFPPHFGPPPPPTMAMPMGPSIEPQMRSSMGPPSHDQMPPHMVDQQFNPHGPPMNSSPRFRGSRAHCAGYQPDGYTHHPQQYASHGEQGGNGYSSSGFRNSNNNINNGGSNNQHKGKRRDSIQSNKSRKNRTEAIPSAGPSTSRHASAGFLGRPPSTIGRPDQNRGRPGLSSCKNDRGLPYENLFDQHFVECSCDRCLESSRSVFASLAPQGEKSNDDLQHALLKHFAQFNPIAAKIRRSHTKLNCLIEFHNDVDMARAVDWSRNPQHQIVTGVVNSVQVWYPLYSKHYVPRTRNGTQSWYQSHSLNKHNRRESNPFRNQQPGDAERTNEYYIGPVFLPQSFPNPAHIVPRSAPSFTPPNSMIYQQIQPQNQPHVLFNPDAPRRRAPNVQSPDLPATTDKKPIIKTAHSQDVRRSQIMSEESWRQFRAKPPSEVAVVNREDDAVQASETTSSVDFVESVEVSVSNEEDFTDAAALLATTRSGLPEGVQTEQLHKERPQTTNSRKEQHTKDTSRKTKSQRDKSKKERSPANDPNVLAKIGDNSVDTSKTVTPDSTEPAQKCIASSFETKTIHKGGGKSVASSRTITPEIWMPVQQDAVIEGTKTTEKIGDTSTDISRTITPESTGPLQDEIMSHQKASPAKYSKATRSSTGENQPKSLAQKDGLTNVSEQQTGYRKTTADLAAPIHSMEAEVAKNDTVTGEYRKTTTQLSSAMETVGYSTDTVIRHKPGRSVLPTEWANSETEDRPSTVMSSTTGGTQDGSATINRFNDVNRQMMRYNLRVVPVENVLQALMTSGGGNEDRDALLPSEASTASAAFAPNNNDAINEGPAVVENESSGAHEQRPKPPGGQKHKNKNKNKNKKRKGQASDSHLNPQSNTSNDLQLRALSPALNRPSSAAAFTHSTSSRGSSPAMQNCNEASSDGAPQQEGTSNTQANNKRKRALPASEHSDGLAKSSGPQDNGEKSARPDPCLQKTKTPQEMAAKQSAPIDALPADGSQTKPLDNPEKSRNGTSCFTGGSLRMSKTRSPRKPTQMTEPLGCKKSQDQASSEAPSIFVPLAKENKDACVEARVFAHQNPIIEQPQKAAPPEMSLEKSNSQTISIKPAKKDDCKIALPKVTLPILQEPPITRPSGSWASVAKIAASCASHAPQITSQADKKGYNDPFAADNNGVTLGKPINFIKNKNVTSPQKHWVSKKEDKCSSDQASPTTLPEKNSRFHDMTSKSQLNAAIRSFSPSTSCTSSPTSMKLRLNPNASAFSLPPSPSQSVTSAAAPDYGHTRNTIGTMKPKEKEKSVAIPRSVPTTERGTIQKGLDKRFITPAEQILNENKVTQPPPPSKDNTGRSTVSSTNTCQILAKGLVAESKTQLAEVMTAEQFMNIATTPSITGQVTGDTSAKPPSAALEATDALKTDTELKTLSHETFPPLNQAAAVGAIKKRRTASIVKLGLPDAPTTALPPGTMAGRNITAPSHVSSLKQTQRGGSKTRQIDAQRNLTTLAPAVAKPQESNVEQKQTDIPGNGLTQPDDKGNWKTVPAKQKTNGGAKKVHGGRTGKHGDLRGVRGGRAGRGGRGGREGASEEPKAH